MRKTPAKIAGELNLLAFASDAAQVVLLRSARIAAGGRAGGSEARLMVTEKLAALAEVQWGVVSGAFGTSPRSVVIGISKYYAGAVRANRKRLSALLKSNR